MSVHAAAARTRPAAKRRASRAVSTTQATAASGTPMRSATTSLWKPLKAKMTAVADDAADEREGEAGDDGGDAEVAQPATDVVRDPGRPAGRGGRAARQ